MIRAHLVALGWSGRNRPDIMLVDRALEHAGMPFRRWCEWPGDGWKLEVTGELVAQGGAIGQLEAEAWEWISRSDGVAGRP